MIDVYMCIWFKTLESIITAHVSLSWQDGFKHKIIVKIHLHYVEKNSV